MTKELRKRRVLEEDEEDHGETRDFIISSDNCTDIRGVLLLNRTVVVSRHHRNHTMYQSIMKP